MVTQDWIPASCHLRYRSYPGVDSAAAGLVDLSHLVIVGGDRHVHLDPAALPLDLLHQVDVPDHQGSPGLDHQFHSMLAFGQRC